METAIIIKKDGDVESRYVYIPDFNKKVKTINNFVYDLKHKLKVKAAINNCRYSIYDIDMNFDNAIKAGNKIIYDNRNSINIKIKGEKLNDLLQTHE